MMTSLLTADVTTNSVLVRSMRGYAVEFDESEFIDVHLISVNCVERTR